MAGYLTGFSANARTAPLTDMIRLSRDRIETAQTEAVTGRHEDLARHLDGRIDAPIDLQVALEDLAHFRQNIVLAEGRADAVSRTLGQLKSLTETLATNGIGALAGNLESGGRALSGEAAQALGAASDALNLTFAGGALFGGDATDRPPLAGNGAALQAGRTAIVGSTSAQEAYAALDAAFHAPGGAYDTTLYKGGAGAAPRSQISTSETVSITVKADDARIRDTLQNIAALALAFDEATSLDIEEKRALAERAIAGLRSNADEMLDLEVGVGAIQERIALAKTRNAAEDAALTLALNEISGRDPYEAAVEFTELENQMQTLFATTSRISALSLLPYLR